MPATNTFALRGFEGVDDGNEADLATGVVAGATTVWTSLVCWAFKTFRSLPEDLQSA
jgi:hypothetical protein